MPDETPNGVRDWHGFRWSAWMPLNAAHPLALAQLPQAPGFYRIRHARRAAELVHVGYAEEGVRERVERLARQVRLAVAPSDALAPEASTLWRLHRQIGVSFHVSGTTFLGPKTEAQTVLHEIRQAYLSPEPR